MKVTLNASISSNMKHKVTLNITHGQNIIHRYHNVTCISDKLNSWRFYKQQHEAKGSLIITINVTNGQIILSRYHNVTSMNHRFNHWRFFSSNMKHKVGSKNILNMKVAKLSYPGTTASIL